jgi:hypothetical protein
VLVVIGCLGTGQHGNGTNTAVEASSLLQTNGSTRNLEVAVAERDVVETLDDCIDDFVIRVLTESDTLWKLVQSYI